MATSRLCPRDATPLVSTADVLGAGTPALTCPKCAGISLDWAQAEPLFATFGLSLSHVHQLVQQGQQSKRKTEPTQCTACQQAPLRSLTLKGIELDLCENCGHLWFDRGERSRLTQGKFGSAVKEAALAAGQTSQVEGVYEMLWDCEYCSTTRLLGASNRHCPVCGAAQNASKRYFPEEGQEVAANHDFDGADKSCPSCSTPNGAKSNNCRQCGSPLDGAAEVNRVADKSVGVNRSPAPAAAPAKKTPWVAIVLVLAALMLCGTCGALALWKKDVAVEVTGHEWKRSIDIEVYEAVRDSSWCDSMPAGAYDVSKRKEQRSSKQVPDGETCTTRNVDRGNGTFEKRKECSPKYKSEPIYDDKCQYSVDRWHQGRSVSSAGRDGDALTWPVVNLRQKGQCRGCEREGQKHETYTLKLRGAGGEQLSCDVNLSKWQSVANGTKRTVKVGVIAGNTDCDSL